MTWSAGQCPAGWELGGPRGTRLLVWGEANFKNRGTKWERSGDTQGDSEGRVKKQRERERERTSPFISPPCLPFVSVLVPQLHLETPVEAEGGRGASFVGERKQDGGAQPHL